MLLWEDVQACSQILMGSHLLNVHSDHLYQLVALQVAAFWALEQQLLSAQLHAMQPTRGQLSASPISSGSTAPDMTSKVFAHLGSSSLAHYPAGIALHLDDH